MSHVIDLSARLDENTAVYPGDPPLSLAWITRIPKSAYNLSSLKLGPHTGTHVDAPLHFMEGGAAVGSMEPSLFMGDALCVDCPKNEGQDVGLRDIADTDIRKGDIVLFRTGWEERSGTPRFFQGEYPGFEPALIEELARRGVKAVGFDSPSADSPRALREGAKAHKAAARLSLPIFESVVNLAAVSGKRFTFVGLPLSLMAAEASPVRAVAIIG